MSSSIFIQNCKSKVHIYQQHSKQTVHHSIKESFTLISKDYHFHYLKIRCKWLILLYVKEMKFWRSFTLDWARKLKKNAAKPPYSSQPSSWNNGQFLAGCFSSFQSPFLLVVTLYFRRDFGEDFRLNWSFLSANQARECSSLSQDSPSSLSLFLVDRN